jgi:hypothetical protein
MRVFDARGQAEDINMAAADLSREVCEICEGGDHADFASGASRFGSDRTKEDRKQKTKQS